MTTDPIKAEVNASQAIKRCSDKNFSKITHVGGKAWVTMEAKSFAKNEAMRKDIQMLSLLKNSTVARTCRLHEGRTCIVDFMAEGCEQGDDKTLAKITVELIEPFGFDLMCLMIKQFKTQQKMTMASVAHYFYQVCDGIEYMHTVGVIHGDAKLQNFLVTQAGDIKIVDFGHTVAIGEMGGRFPSASHMAPEARGKYAKASTAIDIHCLGKAANLLSNVLADGDKERITLTSKKCVSVVPEQRIKLQDLLKEEWLSLRHCSTFHPHAAGNQIPKCRMKGFAMLVNEEVLKHGDTIGKAKLMQKGIQVLYVDRRNREIKPAMGAQTGRLGCLLWTVLLGLSNLWPGSDGAADLKTEEGSDDFEKVPGHNTEIKLNDWIYFGIAEGECQVFEEAIAEAMNPDMEVPYVFPVHLSFSEVELPKEIDGYVLGPDIPLLQKKYAELPQPPKGYLNLRNRWHINLAGVRRNGTLSAFPGPSFVLKAGDTGLFVQAQGADGRLTETHNLESISDSFRAAVGANAVTEKTQHSQVYSETRVAKMKQILVVFLSLGLAVRFFLRTKHWLALPIRSRAIYSFFVNRVLIGKPA